MGRHNRRFHGLDAIAGTGCREQGLHLPSTVVTSADYQEAERLVKRLLREERLRRDVDVLTER